MRARAVGGCSVYSRVALRRRPCDAPRPSRDTWRAPLAGKPRVGVEGPSGGGEEVGPAPWRELLAVVGPRGKFRPPGRGASQKIQPPPAPSKGRLRELGPLSAIRPPRDLEVRPLEDRLPLQREVPSPPQLGSSFTIILF